MKWMKRLMLAVVFLAVLAGVLAAVGWKMLHGRPSWYARAAVSPQERAAAAERAERQLQRLLSEAQTAQHQQKLAAAATAPVTQPAGALQLVLTEDEINAFFDKWDHSYGWSRRYRNYLSDPQIILHDGHIILAADVKQMDLLVSVHFEPLLENGKLRLRVVNVLGGQLPMPQAVWGQYQERLERVVRETLPQLQKRAAIGPDGANTDAVSAAMGELLAHVLADEPAEPVIFLPYSVKHGDRYLPVRLTGISIEDKTLTLTGEPVPPSQRAALLDQIKAPLSTGTASTQ